MPRTTDKELKAVVCRINTLMGLSNDPWTDGAIFLAHRYDYRAIDKYGAGTKENTLETGMTAMETKMFLYGILQGITLAREKVERETILESKPIPVEGFSNYETAMVGLFIANSSDIYEPLYNTLFKLKGKITYRDVFYCLARYEHRIIREYNLEDDWLSKVNIMELVTHFNTIWGEKYGD